MKIKLKKCRIFSFSTFSVAKRLVQHTGISEYFLLRKFSVFKRFVYETDLGKKPPGKKPSEKYHLEKSHPGKIPPKKCCPEKCHPGKMPPRKKPPKKRHPGINFGK